MSANEDFLASARRRKDWPAVAHWAAAVEADRAYYAEHQRQVAAMAADGRLAAPGQSQTGDSSE